MTEDNLLGTLDHRLIDGEDLIDNAEKSIESRLDEIDATNGHIAMEDFLQSFGIGNEAVAIADQAFQDALGIGFMRMRGADQVHRNIRVQEDQG